jgi:predicted nucleic acid-binding protein
VTSWIATRIRTSSHERDPGTTLEWVTRPARHVDLMIAAVALAHDVPLYTCNLEDFEHLEDVGLRLQPVERD